MEKYMNEYLDYLLYQKKYSDKTIIGYRDDLVFFKDYETMDGIGHCGIYIGDGNFIHASSGTGYCVKISTLLSGSYATRYETARRVI